MSLPAAFGDYEVLGELGRGGMGRVLRVRHRPTGALRALKLLATDLDPETLERFRREGEALARVAGRGVVRVHETGRGPTGPWFVMELLPSGSLRERLARDGRLPWDEAARTALALARTLERCHAAGLVHRDLKPENVLLADDGTPCLADFGCVRDVLAERLTRTGESLGTPGYMAPEQLAGEPATPRSDVFAVGVLLHELVAGALPFGGHSWPQVLRAVEKGEREPLDRHGAPAALERAVARALARDPARRTASAAELARDLEAALAGKAPRAGRSILAGLGVAALAGVGLWLALHPVKPAAVGPSPAGSPSPGSVASPRANETSAALAARILASTGALTTTDVPLASVRLLVEKRETRALARLVDAGLVYPLEEIAAIPSHGAPAGSALADLLAFARVASRPDDRAGARAALKGTTSRVGEALRDALADADRLAAALEEAGRWVEHGAATRQQVGELVGQLATRAPALGPDLVDPALAPLVPRLRHLVVTAQVGLDAESSGSLETLVLAALVPPQGSRQPHPLARLPGIAGAVAKLARKPDQDDDLSGWRSDLSEAAARLAGRDPILAFACKVGELKTRTYAHRAGVVQPMPEIRAGIEDARTLEPVRAAPGDVAWLLVQRRILAATERDFVVDCHVNAPLGQGPDEAECLAAFAREEGTLVAVPGSRLTFAASRGAWAHAYVEFLLVAGRDARTDREIARAFAHLKSDDWIGGLVQCERGEIADALERIDRSLVPRADQRSESRAGLDYALVRACRALVLARAGRKADAATDLATARTALGAAPEGPKISIRIPQLDLDAIEKLIASLPDPR